MATVGYFALRSTLRHSIEEMKADLLLEELLKCARHHYIASNNMLNQYVNKWSSIRFSTKVPYSSLEQNLWRRLGHN